MTMRLSLYSVSLVLIMFAMAYKARPTPVSNRPLSQNAVTTTEGSFRDGLYLGRLHRKRGLASHPAAGRWSRESDRRLFEAGYARGYSGNDE